MRRRVILPSKPHDSILTASFPFQDLLLFGETIAGQTVQVFDPSEQDPDPDLILMSSATNDGVTVFQDLYLGVPGVTYTIVVTVAGSMDHIYVKQAYLAIAQSPESFTGP